MRSTYRWGLIAAAVVAALLRGCGQSARRQEALWTAVIAGRVEEVRRLLRAGADPNTTVQQMRDLGGPFQCRKPVLHDAVRYGRGRTDMVQVLLEAVADPNAGAVPHRPVSPAAPAPAPFPVPDAP